MASAVVPVPAAHAEKQDARKHYDKATAAFGLGRYGEAAAEYEESFRLRPDPALLYNCAQSYRLAGNKARALELYRNYLRLYGDAPNAEDARKHVTDLEIDVAAEKAAAGHAAPGPSSVATAAAATPTAGPRSSSTAAAPVVVESSPASSPSSPALGAPIAPPAPAPDLHLGAPAVAATDTRDGSVAGKPWFWVAIGAVVVGGTVAVLLATRGEKDPKATLGTVMGN